MKSSTEASYSGPCTGVNSMKQHPQRKMQPDRDIFVSFITDVFLRVHASANVRSKSSSRNPMGWRLARTRAEYKSNRWLPSASNILHTMRVRIRPYVSMLVLVEVKQRNSAQRAVGVYRHHPTLWFVLLTLRASQDQPNQ